MSQPSLWAAISKLERELGVMPKGNGSCRGRIACSLTALRQDPGRCSVRAEELQRLLDEQLVVLEQRAVARVRVDAQPRVGQVPR